METRPPGPMASLSRSPEDRESGAAGQEQVAGQPLSHSRRDPANWCWLNPIRPDTHPLFLRLLVVSHLEF